MKKQSDAYAPARGLLSVNVTNFEAWTGLFVIWLGKMNYPLVTTLLTKKRCNKIQSKAINASLSKCGFSRTTNQASLSKCGFSRTTNQAVVFGPPWYGIVGWHHLNFEQVILHTTLIINHI
jgi:hypothetical protein